jgi:hypothetical protein
MKQFLVMALFLAGSSLAPVLAQDEPDDPLLPAHKPADNAGKITLNTTHSRTAFYRMEENAVLKVQVVNNTAQTLPAGVVRVAGEKHLQQTRPLARLESGQSAFVELPINTALRPGRYALTLKLEGAGQNNLSEELKQEVVIVPRALQRIPVILWGTPDSNAKAKRLGFTGSLIRPIDHEFVWNNGSARGAVPEAKLLTDRQRLDRLTALNMDALVRLNPGHYLAPRQAGTQSAHPEYNRLRRDGKQHSNTNGLFPRIQQFHRDTGEAVAKSFGDFPVFKGALVNGEVRDKTSLSFHEIDRAAYRAFSGKEIPELAQSTRGVSYQKLPNFPANRVVADDHDILQYYRWFWKEGDGWNKLNGLVADGIKSTGRKDIFTWIDPAVRVPSVYGSGGNVDFINQWTYTYPDPLKIELATQELLAMAKGKPGQQVMSMTQAIWYRTGTTEPPKAGQENAWEKAVPDAKYISAAPDHLSQALWHKLSQPIQAIAYHGWGSLGAEIGYRQSAYFTTNTEAQKRLTQSIKEIVEPLGPTLLQVPAERSEVAFLESFTSQMLAGRGTYGWGVGWGTESYLIARYAGLQPEIIYDETVQQKGLDQYKVLFLMDCDVLSQSVAQEIRKFQDRGGIVVGDERLAPAIEPDILLPVMERDAPLETKRLRQERVAHLLGELQQLYSWPFQSSNNDVLFSRRRFGSSEYLFAVNDSRTFGDYVGQYGKVMEKGLPASARVSLARPAGYVYDLMQQKAVPVQKEGGLGFDVNLAGGGGTVFLVTDSPVGALSATVPATARPGTALPLIVQLNDQAGQPLQAVVPMQVTLLDPRNREAEGSGYYGAANGQLQILFDLAPNDLPGRWRVEVTERITGQKMTQEFTVTR